MKAFLRKVLLPIADNNEEIVSKLTDDTSMKTWIMAFTHESYNPNFRENYEELELLGDSVIRTIFLEYVMEAFPDADRSLMSELASYYLKGYTLHQLSLNLGLHPYINTKIETAIRLDEDVFESFIGALFILGNQRITYGSGFVLCSALLRKLFNDMEFDINKVKQGDPHGRLINYITMIGMRPDDIIEQWIPRDNRIIISLSPNLMKRLNLDNPVLVDMIVGNRGKRDSKVMAYDQALKVLSNMGFTEDWFRSKQLEIELSDPVIGQLYRNALNLAKQRGYDHIELYNPRYSKRVLGRSNLYIEVLGVDKDRKKTVLSIGSGETIRDAKINALRNYK